MTKTDTPNHDTMLGGLRQLICESCSSATSAADIQAVADLVTAYTLAVEHRPPPRQDGAS